MKKAELPIYPICRVQLNINYILTEYLINEEFREKANLSEPISASLNNYQDSTKSTVDFIITLQLINKL